MRGIAGAEHGCAVMRVHANGAVQTLVNAAALLGCPCAKCSASIICRTRTSNSGRQLYSGIGWAWVCECAVQQVMLLGATPSAAPALLDQDTPVRWLPPVLHVQTNGLKSLPGDFGRQVGKTLQW